MGDSLATEGSNYLCFSPLVGLLGQFVFHSNKGLAGHSQWNIDYICIGAFLVNMSTRPHSSQGTETECETQF